MKETIDDSDNVFVSDPNDTFIGVWVDGYWICGVLNSAKTKPSQSNNTEHVKKQKKTWIKGRSKSSLQ